MYKLTKAYLALALFSLAPLHINSMEPNPPVTTAVANCPDVTGSAIELLRQAQQVPNPSVSVERRDNPQQVIQLLGGVPRSLDNLNQPSQARIGSNLPASALAGHTVDKQAILTRVADRAAAWHKSRQELNQTRQALRSDLDRQLNEIRDTINARLTVERVHGPNIEHESDELGIKFLKQVASYRRAASAAGVAAEAQRKLKMLTDQELYRMNQVYQADIAALIKRQQDSQSEVGAHPTNSNGRDLVKSAVVDCPAAQRQASGGELDQVNRSIRDGLDDGRSLGHDSGTEPGTTLWGKIHNHGNAAGAIGITMQAERKLQEVLPTTPVAPILHSTKPITDQDQVRLSGNNQSNSNGRGDEAATIATIKSLSNEISTNADEVVLLTQQMLRIQQEKADIRRRIAESDDLTPSGTVERVQQQSTSIARPATPSSSSNTEAAQPGRISYLSDSMTLYSPLSGSNETTDDIEPLRETADDIGSLANGNSLQSNQSLQVQSLPVSNANNAAVLPAAVAAVAPVVPIVQAPVLPPALSPVVPNLAPNVAQAQPGAAPAVAVALPLVQRSQKAAQYAIDTVSAHPYIAAGVALGGGAAALYTFNKPVRKKCNKSAKQVKDAATTTWKKLQDTKVTPKAAIGLIGLAGIIAATVNNPDVVANSASSAYAYVANNKKASLATLAVAAVAAGVLGYTLYQKHKGAITKKYTSIKASMARFIDSLTIDQWAYSGIDKLIYQAYSNPKVLKENTDLWCCLNDDQQNLINQFGD